jgi:hypothetical protein
MDVKRCQRCEKTKVLAEFYKRKESPDGHRSSCIACEKARNSAYRQVPANKEHVRVTGSRVTQRDIGVMISDLANMELRYNDKARECEAWRLIATTLAHKVADK